MERSRTQCDWPVLDFQGKKNRDAWRSFPGRGHVAGESHRKAQVQQMLNGGEGGFWEERMVRAEAEGGHRHHNTGGLLGPDVLSHSPVGNSDLLRRQRLGSDIRYHVMGAEGGEEALPQSR